jgi:hypothetical protein
MLEEYIHEIVTVSVTWNQGGHISSYSSAYYFFPPFSSSISFFTIYIPSTHPSSLSHISSLSPFHFILLLPIRIPFSLFLLLYTSFLFFFIFSPSPSSLSTIHRHSLVSPSRFLSSPSRFLLFLLNFSLVLFRFLQCFDLHICAINL